MQVLLVHDGTPIMASGLPAMASLLNREKVDCQLRSLYAERSFGLKTGLEDAGDFDLIGIGMHWFYQIPHALEAASAARKVSDRPFIVAGGFTASAFAEEIVGSYHQFDGVIRGDGEVPLIRLVEEIARGKRDLGNVPNLVLRGPEGRPTCSPQKKYVGGKVALRLLDFADFSSLRNLDKYMKSSSWREITDGSQKIAFDIDSTFYLCGGRGCSVQCLYCGGGRESHKIHSWRSKFTFRPPTRLVDDVERAVRLGFGSVHVCFDPLPGGSHWFEFMREVRKRGIWTNLIFESFSLPSEDFLRAVRDSFAAALIVLSPESGVESLRRRMKGFYYSNQEMERRLELIEALGLKAQVFFGYFLPGDSLETVEMTLRYVEEMEARFGESVSFFYYPYSTDPCSPAALSPEKYGLACELRSLADYRRELERREPLRGNLLRHFPADSDRRDWDLLSLRIEVQRALWRKSPEIAARIRAFCEPAGSSFYRDLATAIAEDSEPVSIDRRKLEDLVLPLAQGMLKNFGR